MKHGSRQKTVLVLIRVSSVSIRGYVFSSPSHFAPPAQVPANRAVTVGLRGLRGLAAREPTLPLTRGREYGWACRGGRPRGTVHRVFSPRNGECVMRNLLALVGLLVVGFAIVGWYCGWYTVSINREPDGNLNIK